MPLPPPPVLPNKDCYDASDEANAKDTGKRAGTTRGFLTMRTFFLSPFLLFLLLYYTDKFTVTGWRARKNYDFQMVIELLSLIDSKNAKGRNTQKIELVSIGSK